MAKTNHYYGLILAGGRGTRFWPRSRKKSAKQVLNFFGERTLIQQTVDRLRTLLPPERIWVITNDLLRKEIIKQLPDVPPHQILAEPLQRNTAPAIGLVAQVLHRIDPNAVMGVFPADHIIENPKRYLQFVKPAFAVAEKGSIVVLGMEPRWAESGYGYIQFPKGTKAGSLSPIPVVSFHEKPDAKKAVQYVKAKNYFWNAGMFFWRTDTVLQSLAEHLPNTAEILKKIPQPDEKNFAGQLKKLFPLCDNVSVDVAIMEKAKNVIGLACDDYGWNDVGSWNAVYELEAKGKGDNVVNGSAVAVDSTGNYVDVRSGKLVAIVGVSNLVVVETKDALLIANRNEAQKVSDVVKMLETMRRDDLL